MAIGTATAILGAAVIGAGTSAYSSYKAGEAADDQAKQVGKVADTQSQIASDQWQRYLDTFAPLEDVMTSQFVSPVKNKSGQITGYKMKPIEGTGEYKSTMGVLNRGFSDVAANTRRTLAGRYQFGSGMEDTAQRTIELERSRAKTGAVADLENDRFTKMLNLTSVGRDLPATATAGLSSAGNAYGNLASMYGNAASQGWSSLGNTAGNLMQMYMWNKMKPVV